MKIAVITIAYSSSASITSLLATASSSRHAIECHLFLHSRYPELVAACGRLAQTAAVIYYPFGCNRGVSNSWNEGMLAAYARHADVVIIANDDITFAPRDVDIIAEKAALCRDRYVVSCAGYHVGHRQRLPSVGYACFAINPIAIEKLGCFDQNFFPAYCEDQDFARRAALAGLEEENCPNTMLSHLGSNCILSDPELRRQNAITHGRNLAYYRQKWGGDGGQETFSHPFDNPVLGYHIPAHSRHRPYGRPYDRQDDGIVRI